jgi:hypothetical protein
MNSKDKPVSIGKDTLVSNQYTSNFSGVKEVMDTDGVFEKELMKRQIDELRKVSYKFHIILESLGIRVSVEEAAGDDRSTSFRQSFAHSSAQGGEGEKLAKPGRPSARKQRRN